MSLENEFSLPEVEGAASEKGPAPQSPVIVIEYRNRGFASRLMPPALILCAALAVASYQRKTPTWPLVPAPAPKVADTAATVPKSPERAAPVEPKGAEFPKVAPPILLPDPLAPTTVVMAAKPGAARISSPFDLDNSDGLQPVEPAAPKSALTPTAEPDPTPKPAEPIPSTDPAPDPSPMPAPDETPEPSKDEILRDIEREANQKSASKQDLERLKTNARVLLLRESIAKIDADREPFRDELRKVLAEKGINHGEEIARLCDRYGKEPLPEVKRAYANLLKTASRRMSRAGRVEMMRAVGVPEPLILDQICHDFDKLINTRNGPRNQDEVRVRAGRALLAIPLTTPAPQPDADAPARP